MRKLTKEELYLMVELFKIKRFKDQQISDLFGVSRRYVNNVRIGERCSSLTGIIPTKKTIWNKSFMEALNKIEKQQQDGNDLR